MGLFVVTSRSGLYYYTMITDYTDYIEKASKPLALDATKNTRDLGGYPTEDGKVTQLDRFLRSDPPSGLTVHDLEYLATYDIGCVIDLRTEFEISRAPDSDIPGARYVNYPLLDGLQTDRVKGDFPPSMAELYIGMLERSQDTLLKVFREMLATKGCVLFHCTGGKDRTGVIAMLLLKLAGVSDDLVVADYAVTAYYMKDAFDAQRAYLKQAGIYAPDFVMESDPQSMRQTLSYLEKRYGGSRKYLSQIGLSDDELAWFRDRLIG